MKKFLLVPESPLDPDLPSQPLALVSLGVELLPFS